MSAFTAFLGALTPENSQSVTLIYGARTPALILFQDLILAQLARVPNFQVSFFSEMPNAAFERDMAVALGRVSCMTGRIALDQVWAQFRVPQEQVFYISGPPVMLAALSAGLRTRGIAPERIRTDAWE